MNDNILKVHFDTNIYNFIAEKQEAQAVREYLDESGLSVQASSGNLLEIYAISDVDRCKNRLKVFTTVASSYEPKPQSYHQAMEVLNEIKKLQPYWLRKPVSEKMLIQSDDYLRGHRLKWESAKKVEVPSSPTFKTFRRDFEHGVSLSKESQKTLRQRLLENDLLTKLATFDKGQINELHEGSLSDPEFYWRCDCLMVWYEAIARKKASSRDYADWLKPYIKDNAFHSHSYPHFWLQSIRAHKVNKNRISSLVSYYQLKNKINHGNQVDQIHACHCLDTDLFFTADKPYFKVLKDASSHFHDHAAIILLDGGAKSALEEIKSHQTVWEKMRKVQ